MCACVSFSKSLTTKTFVAAFLLILPSVCLGDDTRNFKEILSSLPAANHSTVSPSESTSTQPALPDTNFGVVKALGAILEASITVNEIASNNGYLPPDLGQ